MATALISNSRRSSRRRQKRRPQEDDGTEDANDNDEIDDDDDEDDEKPSPQGPPGPPPGPQQPSITSNVEPSSLASPGKGKGKAKSPLPPAAQNGAQPSASPPLLTPSPPPSQSQPQDPSPPSPPPPPASLSSPLSSTTIEFAPSSVFSFPADTATSFITITQTAKGKGEEGLPSQSSSSEGTPQALPAVTTTILLTLSPGVVTVTPSVQVVTIESSLTSSLVLASAAPSPHATAAVQSVKDDGLSSPAKGLLIAMGVLGGISFLIVGTIILLRRKKQKAARAWPALDEKLPRHQPCAIDTGPHIGEGTLQTEPQTRTLSEAIHSFILRSKPSAF